MPDPPPKRRWFRFSLRTMSVAVTVFGVWLGWQLKIVSERKAILNELRAAGKPISGMIEAIQAVEAEIGSIPGLNHCQVSRLRRWLGDESVFRLFIPVGANPELIHRTEIAFPEASLVGDNDAFRDSLYAPSSEREPNRGNIFKTGLIEK